ncbi:Uncharacterised protein [Mycobacteroides abscessus subsp. abscessus]|nr:Uncharacterised protein [Mycobacteroides abscessus subsp. abscessus]
MWDYDSLIGKAGVYFQRAANHPSMDDDEFALWMLLGLEFLLRAPLAKVHPSLLAAPEGDAILHASGITTTKDPRSIPTHTVLERLKHVVPDFTDDRMKDTAFLTNLRNAEVHTGNAALANISTTKWLPRFIRIADAICTNLGLTSESLLSVDVAAHARALVDEEDAKTKHQVAGAVSEAKAFYGRLTDSEIQQRTPALSPRGDWDDWEPIACPACGNKIAMSVTHLRTGTEQIDDDEFRTDNVWVASDLHCPVCTLHLQGTAEIAAAGVEQQYVRIVVESIESRYLDAHEYVDYEYGND